MGNVIHWELCKKSKFNHPNKWYILNSESVPETETHEILWGFEPQTNHLISARRLDLVRVKKKQKTYRSVDSAVQTDHRVKLKENKTKKKKKKKKKKKRYVSTPCMKTEKTIEHESDDDTNCKCRTWYSHQRIGTGTGGLGNKKTNGDHPNYSMVDNSQNTKKSPADLRRIAITHTPVKKNHRRVR